ncbi:hypothetical protein FZC66_08215 [Priestia megaterium]|nr:hypothetical protein FZC66_08215 [Priestia megaterium]
MAFIIVMTAIIIAIIIVKSFNRPRRSALYHRELPSQLGVIEGEGFENIVTALESSLTTSYIEQVKARMKKEYPHIQPHELDWALFELKRYFVMNAILREVPMFSSKVDDVWHEMIMYTKDYEQFTTRFLGRFLHHQPNADKTPTPQTNKRAFFDWVYAHLFDVKDNSRLLWGRFFQHPLDSEVINDFTHLSEDELLMKYFSSNEKWEEQKRKLIREFKDEIGHAATFKKENPSHKFKKSAKEREFTHAVLFQAFMFYSIYEYEDYSYYMDELLLRRPEQGDGGAYYSGYACSSPIDDHPKHGHGGNDYHDSGFDSGGDSGSSCSSSSCGSGCGSS